MDEEILDVNQPEAEEEQPQEGKCAISADLIRGHINTIILRTLDERDKYGYEIIDEIEAKSHGQYTLKQPTLYSALKRLESQGYIKAYWKTDEVSSGGRRKYFTLTDLGREFSEKNQSEWEYSRTVIDSLISDKTFDFTKPAPTDVDFNLLKKSVTRIPTGEKAENDEDKSEQRSAEQSEKLIQDDYRRAYVETVQTAPVQSEYSQQTVGEVVIGKTAEEQITDGKAESPSKDLRSEEEKRLAHENFLKLISSAPPSPETPKPKDESIVPHSDEIDTQKLIYNNKPETERDYKTLVNLIFSKAIKSKPQTENNQSYDRAEVQPVYAQRQQTDAAVEKGKTDGLKVNVSAPSSRRSSSAVNTTYNIGSTLFACSAIVGLIFLIEFVVCLLIKDYIEVSVVYPLVILAIGFVQFAFFGMLALGRYGTNAAKPTQHNYLSVSVILTIIAILIICLVGFLLNVNVQSVSDVMAKLVIPSIIALNIPIFAISYYLFVKNR